MIEVQKYLEALDEIIEWQKKKKDCFDLSENIIVAVINQLGIDFRLRKDNSAKSETKEPIKEIIPATEGQIQTLKNMNKFKEGLSKAEAWNIINENKTL